jgi:hypothetical protein
MVEFSATMVAVTVMLPAATDSVTADGETPGRMAANEDTNAVWLNVETSPATVTANVMTGLTAPPGIVGGCGGDLGGVGGDGGGGGGVCGGSGGGGGGNGACVRLLMSISVNLRAPLDGVAVDTR